MQLSKKLFRDLIILLFGLAGIGWFFYSFSQYHPFSTGKITQSKDKIIEKADSVFQSWQYQSLEFFPSTNFSPNSEFIDTVQVKWGKGEFKKKIEESQFLQRLPLLSWEIREYTSQPELSGVQVRFGLNTSGEVISFTASNELISRQRPFNRYAVRSVFQNQVQNYARALEDSLIRGLTDYQHLNTTSTSGSHSSVVIERLREIRGSKDEEVYTTNNIWDLVDFYINRTAWSEFDLKQDTVQLIDEGGIRFARAVMSAEDSLTGVGVELTLDVLPAGSLKSLEYELYPKLEAERGIYTEVLKSTALFVMLVFGMWLLFVFYLRIKARAIDTQPAMIIAVLAGFIIPGAWILQLVNELGLMYGLSGANQIINNVMGLAVLGAVSAIGFFVITAVSDSITRQYWPSKLKTWDLVRRGLFTNKPVGWGIINAIAIAGLLSGIVGIFFAGIPSSYLSADIEFISDNYFLPSLANLMVTASLVLIIVIPIYLILGNQIKGVINRDWVIPIMSALLFCLLDILPFSIEPDAYNRMMNATLGLVLGYFYLRHDFLTIVFGFFVFLNLVSTSKGWVIEGSPDANTFYLFILVLLSFSVLGLYFIVKGRDRKELPEYVPAYIEEQAKEQRLKQELSIARVVQQTFLPSKIHHLPGIDIAGVCIPAQETGGDYYDMISLGEQRTAIAIGDVSGKGIRAAFYMTFTKGVLHSLSALILSPVELLNQLNRLFNENATRGTFISMIYGILEADKRVFTFARAGHNPMLIVRNNGDTEWLKPDGLGIGVTKGDKFLKHTQEATLKLKEGDVVILYTDGITEMLNSGNHFYGEERLKRLVKGVRKASSEKILEIIIDDVNEFKGMAKQHDDMTLVIIKADASVNQ
ncbi:MAG: SpoIIE family protein phosphatase [Gracilimonas sp.]|uniref:SpoIIE family protein phosphatase n=1 Tax=Gracilimonas sp. TaxID=1974203 RepID=UPI00199F4BB5|nr:SpoIIE family protein phosphatase [Gracilimonas sp.]MBD3617763.1 SpoIIE family protein phosphatase [Gracilimonas sp.]